MATSFTQMFENFQKRIDAPNGDLDSVSHNLANINTTGYKKQVTNSKNC